MDTSAVDNARWYACTLSTEPTNVLPPVLHELPPMVIPVAEANGVGLVTEVPATLLTYSDIRLVGASNTATMCTQVFAATAVADVAE